jgi:hypothetical protein
MFGQKPGKQEEGRDEERRRKLGKQVNGANGEPFPPRPARLRELLEAVAEQTDCRKPLRLPTAVVVNKQRTYGHSHDAKKETQKRVAVLFKLRQIWRLGYTPCYGKRMFRVKALSP